MMPTETQNCLPIASTFALLGTVLGYGIRIWIAQQTASRKEDWERLRELTEHVNTLVDEVIAFFCTKGADAVERRSQAIRIQRLVSTTNQKVMTFCKTFSDISVLEYQKRLRQAITKDGFDADVSRPILNPSDDKIIEIEGACDSLIGALDRAYTKLYRGRRVL